MGRGRRDGGGEREGGLRFGGLGRGCVIWYWDDGKHEFEYVETRIPMVIIGKHNATMHD